MQELTPWTGLATVLAALALGLGSPAQAEPKEKNVETRSIQVQPSGGGYNCRAASAASDAPIICRSRSNKYDVRVYRRTDVNAVNYTNNGGIVIRGRDGIVINGTYIGVPPSWVPGGIVIR
ncbi:MAG: hypothetical protein NW237_14010 [Cyanobacteriota bacterium]|nr:hypothetical protein [Cyanobacteriota bacterium]